MPIPYKSSPNATPPSTARLRCLPRLFGHHVRSANGLPQLLAACLAVALVGRASYGAPVDSRPGVESATTVAAAGSLTVASPDGTIEVSVEIASDKSITYRVARNGQELIRPSAIQLKLRDGTTLGRGLADIQSEGPAEHRSTWRPVYGERSVVKDHFHELVIRCRQPDADASITYAFRCYDSGVAFRSEVIADDTSRSYTVTEEKSEFRVSGDPFVWRTNSAQGEYQRLPLSRMGSDTERPLVMQMGGGPPADGGYVAITEAKLVDFARMKLRRSSGDSRGVVSQLGSDVKARGRIETPWRVVLIGDSPGDLLEANDLILNLNDPCAIATLPGSSRAR